MMTKQHSTELLQLERERNACPPSFLIKPSKKGLLSERKTFKIGPCSALNQVKSFLPQLAQANTDLKTKLRTVPPDVIDIENIDHCDGDVIEMNIALMEQPSDDDDSSESDCESDSESSDDDSQKTGGSPRHHSLGEVTENNLKFSSDKKRAKRPEIVIISDSDDETKTDSDTVEILDDSR